MYQCYFFIFLEFSRMMQVLSLFDSELKKLTLFEFEFAMVFDRDVQIWSVNKQKHVVGQPMSAVFHHVGFCFDSALNQRPG